MLITGRRSTTFHSFSQKYFQTFRLSYLLSTFLHAYSNHSAYEMSNTIKNSFVVVSNQVYKYVVNFCSCIRKLIQLQTNLLFFSLNHLEQKIFLFCFAIFDISTPDDLGVVFFMINFLSLHKETKIINRRNLE